MELALVADDDVSVLAITARWLQEAGYDVITASTFAEARTQIRQSIPAILVADVRLGEFNGLQLALIAREVRPDARIVIISGYDDAMLRRDAKTIGAVFLQKPVQSSALLTAVAASATSRPS